jgi:hypothetical protein
MMCDESGHLNGCCRTARSAFWLQSKIGVDPRIACPSHYVLQPRFTLIDDLEEQVGGDLGEEN